MSKRNDEGPGTAGGEDAAEDELVADNDVEADTLASLDPDAPPA